MKGHVLFCDRRSPSVVLSFEKWVVLALQMLFDVVSSVEPDHLQLIVSGEFSSDKMFQLIDYVRTMAEKASKDKVLIDCSKIEGNLSEADRFQGGQRVAQVFGSRLKAVVIMPLGQVTKLGELTARNRGAVFLVTDSREEAVDWLGKQ